MFNVYIIMNGFLIRYIMKFGFTGGLIIAYRPNFIEFVFVVLI